MLVNLRPEISQFTLVPRFRPHLYLIRLQEGKVINQTLGWLLGFSICYAEDCTYFLVETVKNLEEELYN